ncbi:hypothetical protein N0V94_006203 [Neodidymelliopsis sp. IMI 364377]|nr:hypothetical protein N0V94_006203 [Neodidymelliopsis sp. IMI 364377]
MMQTNFFFLIMTVTLGSASRLRNLPPIVVRALPQNSTLVPSAGQNATTQAGEQSVRDYDTIEYRAFMAFLALGVTVAILFLPVVFGPFLWRLYRKKQAKKRVQERMVELKVAWAKMQAMTEPQPALLRPERA